MSDRFVLVTAADVQADLSLPDGRSSKTRKAALRKVVSNMTVNNPEMLSLFPDVMHCMHSNDPETKRLCFLYIESYVKASSSNVGESASQLSREVNNMESSTTIRAIALRILSSVSHKQYVHQAILLIPNCLKSPDMHLRKTACFATAKVWSFAPGEVERSALLGYLNQLFVTEMIPVVASAVCQALLAITDSSPKMEFIVDFSTAKRLSSFLQECPEFAQVSILEALNRFTPHSSLEAETLCETIKPGLRNTNSAISLGTARCCLMLSHYSLKLNNSIPLQVFSPLISQLSRPPEIQYCILRNIYLLLQTLGSEVLSQLQISHSTFICKSSDLNYIRSTKIDILVLLCTSKNVESILKELLAFIQVKDDKNTQNKAIQAFNRIGSNFPQCLDLCLQTLQSSIATHPEAISAIVSLVRRYPQNQQLIQDSLHIIKQVPLPSEEEAKCAYLWLTSTFNQSPTQQDIQLLKSLLSDFAKQSATVQATILTCCVKLSLKFPSLCSNQLVPQVYHVATTESLDPDVRDRAFMYWHLFTANPQRMESIIAQSLPPIVPPKKLLDLNELEDLELSLGYISSLYLKPAEQLFRASGVRQLAASSALLPRRRDELQNNDPTVLRTSRAGTAPLPQPTFNTANNAPNDLSKQKSRPQILQRQSTFMGQFQEIHSQTPPLPDEQNVRLIDI